MANESVPVRETGSKAKSCKKCGVSYEGRGCKPCFAAYMNAWNKRNKEKVRRSKADSYQRNKDTCRLRNKRNQDANRERYAASRREKYAENRETYLARAKALMTDKQRAKRDERVREWRAQTVEKAREHARNAYWRHKDRFAKRAKSWRERNPDKCAVHRATRRAHVLAAEGSHTADDVAAIRKAQRNCCAVCSLKLQGKGHVDHIVALSKGGTNARRNLQLLCQSCNSRKADIDPIEFMQRIGRLL